MALVQTVGAHLQELCLLFTDSTVCSEQDQETHERSIWGTPGEAWVDSVAYRFRLQAPLKVQMPHDDNLQDGVRGQHRTQKLAHDLSSELHSDRRDCLRVLLWV